MSIYDLIELGGKAIEQYPSREVSYGQFQQGGRAIQQPQKDTKQADERPVVGNRAQGILSAIGGGLKGAGGTIGRLAGSLASNTGDFLRDHPDFLDTATIAVEGLSQRPNQPLIQMAQNRMGLRQQEQKILGDANKTSDWLRSQGQNELADLILERPEMASSIVSEYASRRYFPEATEQWETFTGEDGKLYRRNMLTNKVEAVGGGGTTINTGSPANKFGPIPSNHFLDDSDPMNPVYRVIAGSPEQRAIDQKAKESEQQSITSGELGTRAGSAVYSSMVNLYDSVLNEGLFTPVTGITGAIAANIPATNASNANRYKQTIVANIGFDRLQQMRDASPTGGALGQVSEQELSTLQAVLGSLELDQSQDVLLANIRSLQGVYAGIMKKFANYDNASDFMSQEEISYFKDINVPAPEYLNNTQSLNDPLNILGQ